MIAGNSLKTALANKQQQIGLWLSMAEPYLAESRRWQHGGTFFALECTH